MNTCPPSMHNKICELLELILIMMSEHEVDTKIKKHLHTGFLGYRSIGFDEENKPRTI